MWGMWFDETKADLFHHRSKKCLVQTEEPTVKQGGGNIGLWGSAGTRTFSQGGVNFGTKPSDFLQKDEAEEEF